MGLQQSFEAVDVIPYKLWNGANYIYNTWLYQPPRLYMEELKAVISPDNVGALWAEPSMVEGEGIFAEANNILSPTVIKFLGMLNTAYWPSWAVGYWALDGASGKFLKRKDSSNFSGAAQSVYNSFSVEPGGYVWWFGTAAETYEGGEVCLDSRNLTLRSVLDPIPYGYVSGVDDFAVDRANNRVFMRGSDLNRTNQVSVFKYDTREKVADIYSPNRTTGIVLTGNGYLYLVDSGHWLLLYDYDGAFYGAMRNPPASNERYTYGWDSAYKRLLYLAATASTTTGASTLRVKGFYPVPELTYMTPLVPRSVVRKARKTYCFLHLAGCGGEPIVSRTVKVTGDVITSGLTDCHGNAQVILNPASTDAINVSIEVETP